MPRTYGPFLSGRSLAAANAGWYVLAASSAQVAHTGDTNPFTFATVALPAGSMGANGLLRITTIWSYPNSANAKTLQLQLGGSNIWNSAPTTTAASTTQVIVGNRNSASSQVMTPNAIAATGSWGNTGTAPNTLAINTANAQNIVWIGTLASAAETLNLDAYLVELFYQA